MTINDDIHSNQVLQTLDLNKSDPAVESTASFASIFRRGSRPSRTKTLFNREDEEHLYSRRRVIRRPRKLSLSGFSFLKPHTHGVKTPTTPEIENWKKKTGLNKGKDSDLHYIRVQVSTEEHVDAKAAEEVDGTQPAEAAMHAEKDAPFVNDLNVISPLYTEGKSEASSSSTKRKPVPPLDLSAIINAESTMDSPLLSFYDNYRPYSLISTDIDGNDTPIVRLRRFVVDTKGSDDDEEKHSQLFFRPIAPMKSGSVKEEVMLKSHSDIDDTNLSVVEASNPSSIISTVNAGSLSTQMQTARRTSPGDDDPKRGPCSSLNTDLEDDNQLQYQQQQLSKEFFRGSEVPLDLTPVTDPSRRLLSPRPSGEVKRESVLSSQTDSSVGEAVIGQATSTHLQSLPLQRIKVKSWVRQRIPPDTKGRNDHEDTFDIRVLGAEDDIQDIPDEATSSLEDDYSNRLPCTSTALSEPHSVARRQSSLEAIGADRSAKSSPKRLRNDQKKGSNGGNGELSGHYATSAKNEQEQPGEKPPSSNCSTRPASMKKEKRKKADNESRRHSRSRDGTCRNGRHCGGYSQESTTRKRYLTSEEAAMAKRREKEEKAAKIQERRQKRKLARQEAYAEKKRNDPLLEMRLALVGLSTEDNKKEMQVKEEGLKDENCSLKVSTDSGTALSKASFHTAHQEEEEEECTDMLPLMLSQHRRNQPSTASSMTTISHGRASSIGTLINTVIPQPPPRHGAPTKAEDGTVLARARLQSTEASISSLHHLDDIESSTEASQAFERPHEHRIALHRDASLRESPAKIKRPFFVDGHEQYEVSRLRRSFVPDVFDRFSLQSFVN